MLQPSTSMTRVPIGLGHEIVSQGSLFHVPQGGPTDLLPHGLAKLHYGVLEHEEAEAAFVQVLETTPWEQRSIELYDRTVLQPRLVAWFGDSAYTYSGLTLEPHGWTPLLNDLRRRCEAIAGIRFNSLLANLYRDGQDSVAWHADDEPELGQNPTIASMSLGAVRRFDLRHRETGETVRTALPPGSVLVMSGASQRAWIHQVPKTKTVTEPRINLTFRRLVQP
jgi:alkylated DNA repair dioxygenase AlkB